MNNLNQNFKILTFRNGNEVTNTFINENPTLFLNYPSQCRINTYLTHFRNNPNKSFILKISKDDIKWSEN